MDRLYRKGFVTTFIGLSILSFCGVMLWTQKATVDELSGGFDLGVLLVRSKDSLLGIPVDDQK